ncbi:unnamed protein product [Adineta steineri]|uniref:NHL repeat containing protein n=1 Tax=Adineta steineri TaxID=433720 RepID=A0A819MDF4_9BILA|nr:unnamed protein product [Adineta steineri]CAF3977759.1 unnamed protein product [Adineta steineri]
MNMNNRVGPDESAVINSSPTPFRRFYEHFRKRKLIRIIFSIICIIVITAVITTTILLNKTEREKISTTEVTTSTTTKEITITSSSSTTTTTTTATTSSTTTSEQLIPSVIIDKNTKWKQNAITVAGGNEQGSGLNQLSQPNGIYIDDDDQSIYIADTQNHRIVKWKFDANNGEIVPSINEPGNPVNKLMGPTDVILDKKKTYLIICDRGNRRVIKWSVQNSQDQQILIHNILCLGLSMNNNEDLYISDPDKHQVIRWRQGDIDNLVVAGGNKGSQFNQLDMPRYIFVDEYDSVYVADSFNNRVMKWTRNATQGILIAPGQVSDKNSNSMIAPMGVIVDHMGNIYVSCVRSHQIMRWSSDAIDGTTVVGEKNMGSGFTQFVQPYDLSFDRQGNLYVVDAGNNRIQKFDIDLD